MRLFKFKCTCRQNFLMPQYHFKKPFYIVIYLVNVIYYFCVHLYALVIKIAAIRNYALRFCYAFLVKPA